MTAAHTITRDSHPPPFFAGPWGQTAQRWLKFSESEPPAGGSVDCGMPGISKLHPTWEESGDDRMHL